MPNKSENALFAAIYLLLKPLARILLRNGVSYGSFAELARRVFVKVAEEDFEVPGRKQTNSRISTITGLSRKEVQRLKDLGDGEDTESLKRYNRAARVVTGWVRDPRFQDSDAQPLDLTFDGKSSFCELVKTFSGDIPPRAILDELIQVGMVTLNHDKIHLLGRVYIPKTSETEKLTILGTDVAGLIATIDHNIQSQGKDPYFQRKVYYDNLPVEAIPELRAFIAEHAQQLLETMDQNMSRHDRDVNPNVQGTGRNAAGIGIYFFTHDVKQEDPS